MIGSIRSARALSTFLKGALFTRTGAWQPGPWIVLVVLVLLLSGCGSADSALRTDNAFGTIVVPTEGVSCQVRQSVITIEGGGALSPVTGRMDTRVLTVISPDKCPEGLPISVPTWSTVPMGPSSGVTP